MPKMLLNFNTLLLILEYKGSVWLANSYVGKYPIVIRYTRRG